MTLYEPLPQLFSNSEVLTLNFSEISEEDEYKNIKEYMHSTQMEGKNPREALYRQKFNEDVLSRSSSRYLIGRYVEDRRDMLKGSHIEQEGRTFHLAVDIFSVNQESVFAPCSGEIIVSAKESGSHGFGNYIILQPNDKSLPYIFFGHLADNKHILGPVAAGEQIAQLGSFIDEENGGWSIHLHLQLLTELPPTKEAPIGYSSREGLEENMRRFPDPFSIFPDWKVKR
jgi:hypothetical protein